MTHSLALALLALMAMSLADTSLAARSLSFSLLPEDTDPKCFGACPTGSKPILSTKDSCRTMGCSSWLEKVGERCFFPCKQGYVSDGLKCKQTCPEGYVDRGTFCQQKFRVIAKTNGACPVGSEDFGTQCYSRIIPATRPKAERFRMHADPFPTCGTGLDLGWDSLCYTACKAGFTGQGPLCVPSGKDEDAPGTYKRGPGSEPSIPAMSEWCAEEDGDGVVGQSCYVECDPGFAAVATPRGSPALCMEVCPEGYTDGGKVCIQDADTIDKATLKTYTRSGSGVPLRPIIVQREPAPCP